VYLDSLVRSPHRRLAREVFACDAASENGSRGFEPGGPVVISLAALISVAMPAIFHCMAWNSASALPN